MLTTRFTDLVGCSVPIQQAGMGALSPPALVAAVSEAGGLGMLGTGRAGITPATLTTLLAQVQARTTRPFGVNFIISPSFAAQRAALWQPCIELAARSARVVEFFWDVADRTLVSLVHDGGALAGWQVGSREEAVAAEAAGCDFIIAQGIEAGGHVRSRVGLLPLLDEVLGAVSLPVLAAGGIGTGRTMAAALAAGAAGVRVGTRFVAADEAGTHPDYLAALISAGAQDTVYTEAFWVGWPDAPHRVLQSCVVAAETFVGDIVGERESLDGTRLPVRRFASGVASRDTRGNIAAMALWAGEGVGAVTRAQPAAAIIRELADDAEQCLRHWC